MNIYNRRKREMREKRERRWKGSNKYNEILYLLKEYKNKKEVVK